MAGVLSRKGPAIGYQAFDYPWHLHRERQEGGNQIKIWIIE